MNAREQAHSDAIARIEELYSQAASGIIMVKEFTSAVAKLDADLPDLQTGDIDPATGLSMP